MANPLFQNLLSGTTTDNPLTNVATAVNSAGLASMAVVAGGDYMWITLDPLAVNGAPEIVLVTAHSSSATSCTITRAQQGTAARQHPQNTKWVGGMVTKTDLDIGLPSRLVTTKGDLVVATAGGILSRLAVGSNTQALVADSGQTTGQKWVEYLANKFGTTAQQLLRVNGSNAWEANWFGLPQFATTAAATSAGANVDGAVIYVNSGDAAEGVYSYNGTSWRPTSWNVGWGVVAQASTTSNQAGITAIADVTSAAASWTGVSNRLYRVTFFYRGTTSAATGNVFWQVQTGASGAGTVIANFNFPAVLSGAQVHITGNTFFTGSGALALHLRAQISGGASLAIDNASNTGWFVVEDIGPIGNPA